MQEIKIKSIKFTYFVMYKISDTSYYIIFVILVDLKLYMNESFKTKNASNNIVCIVVSLPDVKKLKLCKVTYRGLLMLRPLIISSIKINK